MVMSVHANAACRIAALDPHTDVDELKAVAQILSQCKLLRQAMALASKASLQSWYSAIVAAMQRVASASDAAAPVPEAAAAAVTRLVLLVELRMVASLDKAQQPRTLPEDDQLRERWAVTLARLLSASCRWLQTDMPSTVQQQPLPILLVSPDISSSDIGESFVSLSSSQAAGSYAALAYKALQALIEPAAGTAWQPCNSQQCRTSGRR